MTWDNITAKYTFDVRQTNYYTSAAQYLGLLPKGKGTEGENTDSRTVVYELTNEGRKIMKKTYR